jgi:chemotaxis-related protein WspB
MLFLLFRIGDHGYAFAADEIVEVLPLVRLKGIRRAPAGIAGSFDYRGEFVPAIDLSEIELGRPAQSLLSTRIIMTRYSGGGGSSRLVGLIAERATETLRCDPADFVPFAASAQGLVQRVELDALLTPAVRNFLIGEMAEIS